MNHEIICESCATPIEIPDTYLGSLLVCPKRGMPQYSDESTGTFNE